MSLQMPIRLIATDMDGTLLTDEPLILPETADVLRRAAEKGIVLSLASGRLPDDASFFLPWTRSCQCTSLRSTAR